MATHLAVIQSEYLLIEMKQTKDLELISGDEVAFGSSLIGAINIKFWEVFCTCKERKPFTILLSPYK